MAEEERPTVLAKFGGGKVKMAMLKSISWQVTIIVFDVKMSLSAQVVPCAVSGGYKR